MGSSESVQQPWMTVGDVARYTRLGKTTINNAMREGDLKYVKLGKARVSSVRIHKDDVDAWMESHRYTPGGKG